MLGPKSRCRDFDVLPQVSRVVGRLPISKCHLVLESCLIIPQRNVKQTLDAFWLGGGGLSKISRVGTDKHGVRVGYPLGKETLCAVSVRLEA